MQRLSGGYYFTKIDLADAYNQVKLSPESQQTASTQYSSRCTPTDMPTVWHIICSRIFPRNHGSSYLWPPRSSSIPGRHPSQQSKCKQAPAKSSSFASTSSRKGATMQAGEMWFCTTLGGVPRTHSLTAGVSKGSKVDAIVKMPPPTDITGLWSFLGTVQFYGKFIPNLSMMTEPLTHLTRRDMPWKWGEEQQAAFQCLKTILSKDTILVHYDPHLDIGISCDASNVGIGTMLFHHYPDGSEHPIANASKTLSPTQCRYSQIQREALAVIFGLRSSTTSCMDGSSSWLRIISH